MIGRRKKPAPAPGRPQRGNGKRPVQQNGKRPNPNRPGPDGGTEQRRRPAGAVAAPVGAAAAVASRHLDGASANLLQHQPTNSLTHDATNALAHYATDGSGVEVAATAVGAGAAVVAGAGGATAAGVGAGAGAAAAGAATAGGAAAATGAAAAGAATAAGGASAAGGGAAAGGAAAAGQGAQAAGIGVVTVAAVATVVVVVANTGDEPEPPEPAPVTTTTVAPAPAAPAPTPGPGVFETEASGPLSGDLFAGVDQETEAGPLMVAGLQGQPTNVGIPITLGSGATLQVDPQGGFQYQPDASFEALPAGETLVEEFTYVVTNASGFTEEWTATITVVGENDAPVIDPVTGPTLTEGTTSSVALAATDPDGDPLIYSLAEGAPSFVSIADAGDGTATLAVAPESGTAGTHEVTVNVADNADPALTGSATLTITVQEEEVALARVTERLVGLYNFGEGSGTAVADSSGASAPALTVGSADAVTWNGGSMTINSPTIVRSEGGASALVDAIKESNEFTIEAWVTPADASQAGPARVVSMSAGVSARNVTLAQGEPDGLGGDRWSSRQRSTGTSTNGLPALSAPAGSVTEGSLHQLVLTRTAAGDVTLYVNGTAVATGTAGGDLSNWDNTFSLMLANETSMDRPWLGTYHLVAVYAKALTGAEIEQNRQVGA